jgi:hypothetical protein
LSRIIDIGISGSSTVGFDLERLVSTRLLIQANSGGGKSYTIRRLLEQSHGRIQQIVIDLEGEFCTLREKFDYVIAGKNGDVPADPKSAKLLARKLLELGVSAICDLSELKAPDRVRFVRLFLDSLVGAPRALWHPVLVVLDEAHHFAPEKGQVESYGSVIDLCTRGRKRGLSAVLATQRLSKLHKDACAELLNKMVGRTTLDIDQKRAADELGFIGKTDRIELRNLEPGEFYIYGPALKRGKSVESGVIRAKVGSVLSEHPRAGSRSIVEPPKPTGGIIKILGELTDLPAEAEKEALTVENLRKRNRELQRELTIAKRGQPQPAPCNHEQEIERLKLSVVAQKEKSDAYSNLAKDLISAIEITLQKTKSNLQAVVNRKTSEIQPGRIPKKVAPAPRPVPVPRSPVPEPPAGKPGDNGDLSGPQLKILGVLKAFRELGLDQVHKNMVAAQAGVSPRSGGYFNNLGRLRSQGYIDYPTRSYVSLTEAGNDTAGDYRPITSIQDLHDSWCNIVPGSQARILRALIDIYPDDISKDDLAEIVEVSNRSGGYFNNLGRLRTLGAIEYPSKGRVRASDLLFPEGMV